MLGSLVAGLGMSGDGLGLFLRVQRRVEHGERGQSLPEARKRAGEVAKTCEAEGGTRKKKGGESVPGQRLYFVTETDDLRGAGKKRYAQIKNSGRQPSSKENGGVDAADVEQEEQKVVEGGGKGR